MVMSVVLHYSEVLKKPVDNIVLMWHWKPPIYQVGLMMVGMLYSPLDLWSIHSHHQTYTCDDMGGDLPVCV